MTKARLKSLEQRVAEWVSTRFGPEYLAHRGERAMRLLEEAVELAQAEGVNIGAARKLVEHVYARPAGEPSQEAAGVAVTLLAWCAATQTSLFDITLAEVNRIEAKPIKQLQDSITRKGDLVLVEKVDNNGGYVL